MAKKIIRLREKTCSVCQNAFPVTKEFWLYPLWTKDMVCRGCKTKSCKYFNRGKKQKIGKKEIKKRESVIKNDG